MREPSNYDLFETEIEQEYTTKRDEFSVIENSIILNIDQQREQVKRLLRNTIVVMLYAMFEGYCKRTFEIYIDYLNRTNVKVKEIKGVLAASTLSHEFSLLEDTNHKPERINIDFSVNSKLKRYARRVEFTEEYITLMDKTIELSEEIADTESNLKADVLKRIMYMLGLDITMVDEEKHNLNYILGIRNSAAHGDFERSISDEQYDLYKGSIFHLMQIIKNEVLTNYREQKYRRIS